MTKVKQSMLSLAITGNDIVDGTVGTADIGSGAVTSGNLGAGAVGNTALAANAVDTTKITAAAQLALKGQTKTVVLTALACTTDFTKLCAAVLVDTPRVGTGVLIIGGVDQVCGDGVRTADWYYAAPATSGAAARALSAVVIGDEIWVNCVIGGFTIAAGDIAIHRYGI